MQDRWMRFVRTLRVPGLVVAAVIVATFAGSAPVVGAPTCPCSLFDSSAAPAETDIPASAGQSGPPPHSYELGVKFAVAAPARLTSVRFWKTPAESGSHVGRIWSAGGTELAQASFASETPSGWQQASLSAPITLQPGQTYVASVNANAAYAVTLDGLASAASSGPLQSIADGANGVYHAGAGSFPSDSYRNSNYFVDVVVEELAPPTVTTTPADGASGVDPGVHPSAEFSRDMDAATLTAASVHLEGPGATPVPGTVAYDPATRTVALTPAAALAASTTYTARLDASVAAADGVALGSAVSWTFTTAAAPPPPPPPPPPPAPPAPAAQPAPAPAAAPSADLALTMTADTGSPTVGSAITYTLTATNLGPSRATGVAVQADIPAGLSLRSALSAQGACDSARCAIGSLAAGESVRVSFGVSAIATGEVRAGAVVAGVEGDPNLANNHASVALAVATRVVPVADANVRVSLVRTGLSGRRAARTWVVVDGSRAPFRPVRLQLATDPETPWSWRSYLSRFSFRSSRPEIWLRLSDDAGTVTEWQAFRFAIRTTTAPGRR